jgi:hypothetical protein
MLSVHRLYTLFATLRISWLMVWVILFDVPELAHHLEVFPPTL